MLLLVSGNIFFSLPFSHFILLNFFDNILLLFSDVEKIMKEVDPEIVTIPYLVTGATDSREYRNVADEIYRIKDGSITKMK